MASVSGGNNLDERILALLAAARGRLGHVVGWRGYGSVEGQ